MAYMNYRDYLTEEEWNESLKSEYKNEDGKTCLLYLAGYGLSGDVDKVKGLVEQGANINAQDNDGFTPLHYACWNVHRNMVEELLDNGADPNISSNNGKYPLHIAIQTDDFDIIEYLLKHKANTDITLCGRDIRQYSEYVGCEYFM